jgi:hypothetical protein
MMFAGLQPTFTSMVPLVEALATSGRATQIVRLVKQLYSRAWTPDGASFAAIIAGNVFKCRTELQHMRSLVCTFFGTGLDWYLHDFE